MGVKCFNVWLPIILALTAAWSANTVAVANEVNLVVLNSEAGRHLRGPDARLQLVVSGQRDDESFDATHEVEFEVEPVGLVEISDSFVKPIGEGEATVKIRHASGAEVLTQIRITELNQAAAISFPGRVVPIFTKHGCNSGGCHGKAAGQNGFRLSLLGFEPQEDHEHLVRESRGRRLSLAAPDQSLLLTKATNESPHGGGQRLDKDSHEYRLLRRWIVQGMAYGNGDEAKVVSIEVIPPRMRLTPNSTQQLSVLAHLSDGTCEDVTRAAIFESNDPEMADVSSNGRVRLQDLSGDVTVMARYQGHVNVFRADVPLSNGVPEEAFPQPRNVVDEFVLKKLQSLGIPPSATCDDSTFLRRVTLDIAGRLPTLPESDEFLADSSSDKRGRLIDRLLQSEDYADYFANKWNAILRNRRTGGEIRFANVAFHQWIRDNIAANTRYDRFVRSIVAASGSVASHPPVAWYQQVPDTNQRIEDAAQLFLGQRIQCARCHHHPYEKWSQADYAKMAAFFSLVSKKSGGDPGEPIFFARLGNPSARHPKTGQSLPPAGLSSDEVAVSTTDDPRGQFADWMTDPKNPFFAKSLVNRYWKHFMGRGLVEPEDDLRVTNPPSNPELMDALADQFVKSGFDLRALISLITRSQTYQLQSDASDQNIGDRRSYSRFYPKRLQAEVLLDAIDVVTGVPSRFAGLPSGVRAVALPDNGFDSYFLNVFGRSAATTACECERSQEPDLAQNLHLLNSQEMQDKLSAEIGTAAKLAASDGLANDVKVQRLYRIALSRTATDLELKATLSYLAGKENQKEAFEDVVWSLINSKEFLFNH